MNNIKVNLYRKKNGDVMLYINDYERRVSFGISDRVFTSKMTKGQKNLWDRFIDKLDNVEPVIRDFVEKEEHKEEKSALDFGITLYITDTANVAGHNVEMDGGYFLINNNLYSIYLFNELN